MSTALTTVDLTQLPSTQLGSDEQFEEMSRSTGFLGRLQLFSKGNAINEGLIPPGTYGIPESDKKIVKLGPSDRHSAVGPSPQGARPERQGSDHRQLRCQRRRVQGHRRPQRGDRLELHVRHQLPGLRAEHRPLPGVLLRHQEHPADRRRHRRLPASDPGRHRPQEGRRCRREPDEAARPVSPAR